MKDKDEKEKTYYVIEKLNNIEKHIIVLIERTKQNQFLTWLDNHVFVRRSLMVIIIFIIAIIADKTEDLVNILDKIFD